VVFISIPIRGNNRVTDRCLTKCSGKIVFIIIIAHLYYRFYGRTYQRVRTPNNYRTIVAKVLRTCGNGWKDYARFKGLNRVYAFRLKNDIFPPFYYFQFCSYSFPLIFQFHGYRNNCRYSRIIIIIITTTMIRWKIIRKRGRGRKEIFFSVKGWTKIVTSKYAYSPADDRMSRQGFLPKNYQVPLVSSLAL